MGKPLDIIRPGFTEWWERQNVVVQLVLFFPLLLVFIGKVLAISIKNRLTYFWSK